MAIRSRHQRELERRKKAKKNRSQLLGATQGGQRRPMRQGYTSSSVQPPPFRKSTVADDIETAGKAYIGGNGIFYWTEGAEAYTDKAGKFHKAVEPYAMPDFSRVSNLGENLFNMQPGYVADKSGELTSSWFGTPSPEHLGPLNMGGSGGMGGGFNMAHLEAAKSGAGGGPLGTPMQFQTNPVATQLSTPTIPQGIDKLGLAGAGFGTGMSIYDMVDRGITPGNAMGLIGSLGVGASAFPSLGLAGLGPIGMGIGAIGGLGSLFDLW